MKKIFLILFSFLALFPALAQTPRQILEKSVAVMSSSKGTEAKFSVTNSGYTGSGTILSISPKYHVSLPEIEVWFNGKDLFTYNRHTEETTIVTPTPEELAESNPLAYVTTAPTNYNVAFSTVKKAGRYVLELTPIKKNSEIKRITLTLLQKDYTPEKLVIEPKSGNPVTANITSFRTGVSAKASEFEYPKSRYPMAEIIDLR